MPYRERPLGPKERRVLSMSKGRRNAGGLRRLIITLLVLFVPVLGLAIISTGGRLGGDDFFHLGIYGLILIGIGIWVELEDRHRNRGRQRLIDGVLTHGKVRETAIKASRLWLYEEIEDEGHIYLFELEGGLVAILCGQEFYESSRFPNDDFRINEILAGDGRVVEVLIEKRGGKLAPERRVSGDAHRKRPLSLDPVAGGELMSAAPAVLCRGSLEEVADQLERAGSISPRT